MSAASLGALLAGCSRHDSRATQTLPGRLIGNSSHRIDFATVQDEDALSAGGVWSNKAQGVGGNGAPGNMTSMRVGLASDGRARIAMAHSRGHLP